MRSIVCSRLHVSLNPSPLFLRNWFICWQLGKGDMCIFHFNVGCCQLASSSSRLWFFLCLAKVSCGLFFETSPLWLVPNKMWPTRCNGTYHCHTTHWLQRLWTSCCLQHLLATEQRFVENSSLVLQWPDNLWQGSSSCRCSRMCCPLGAGCVSEFHQWHRWHQGFQASELSDLSSQTHPSVGEFLLPLLGVWWSGGSVDRLPSPQHGSPCTHCFLKVSQHCPQLGNRTHRWRIWWLHRLVVRQAKHLIYLFFSSICHPQGDRSRWEFPDKNGSALWLANVVSLPKDCCSQESLLAHAGCAFDDHWPQLLQFDQPADNEPQERPPSVTSEFWLVGADLGTFWVLTPAKSECKFFAQVTWDMWNFCSTCSQFISRNSPK